MNIPYHRRLKLLVAALARRLEGRAAERLAPRAHRAGAVFVGEGTAVAFGDYVAGSNHVLPTGGTARWASALRGGRFHYGEVALVKRPEEQHAR